MSTYLTVSFRASTKERRFGEDFLIGIHSMQRWTAISRHGVTRKRTIKRLKHTGKFFRKYCLFPPEKWKPWKEKEKPWKDEKHLPITMNP